MAKGKDEYIYFRTKGEVDSIKFEFDEDLSGVQFKMDGMAWTERSFSRAKGDKIVSRVPSQNQDARFSREEAVWDNYDYIIAIDTNYRNIRDVQCAVSGVVGAVRVFLGSNDGVCEIFTSWYCLPAVAFVNPEVSPEKLGWEFLIQQILNVNLQRRYPRIGIVVDAHLSELDDLNSRKVPLRKNRFLPDKMALIYASSDTGKDDFPNKLIKTADTVSSMALRKIEEQPNLLNTECPTNYPCKGVIQIFGKGTVRYEEA